MPNLKHSPKLVLLNSIDYTKVRLYEDSDTRIHMQFLEYGIDLVGAKDGSSLVTLGEGTCYEDCTYAGQKGVVQLLNAPPAPCSNCYFESGITINTRSDSVAPMTTWLPYSKFYGTRLDSVETSSGLVTDTYKIQIEDAILEQLAGDEQRFADGYRVYIIETDDTTDFDLSDVLDLTITVAGTAYNTDDADVVWDTDIATTIANCVAEINTKYTAGTFTYTQIDDRSFYLIGPANLKWTVALGAAAADLAIGTRYLRIEQKYLDTKIDVSFPVGHFTQSTITAAILPDLRGVDVQPLFATKGHHGTLQFAASVPTVDIDADYCKYIFRATRDAYGDPGPNRMETYFEEVEIYVKKTAAETDYWIWTSNAGTGQAHGMEAVAAPSGTADLDFNDAWDYLCDGVKADPTP